MKWWNLKKNKCPKCGTDWTTTTDSVVDSGMIYCACGFKISEKKFKKIVTGMVEVDIEDKDNDH